MNTTIQTAGWIIDEDLFAEAGAKASTNSNAVGLMGPRSYSGDGSDCVHKFRMLTDDNEVVYLGRSNEKDSFRPLDDFGCTIIQYRGKNGWETL
jgi:hypothetical protein